MSQHPYSTRFVAASPPVGWTAYTVPAGKRWVVKQIDICQVANASSLAGVQVAAGVAFFKTLAAQGADFHWSGMQVLYHGEQLQVYTSVVGPSFLISGYEFSDP